MDSVESLTDGKSNSDKSSLAVPAYAIPRLWKEIEESMPELRCSQAGETHAMRAATR
jgi:fatty acid desaturase